MKLFTKTRWMILDCLTGESRAIERVPFTIGSAEIADFRLNGPTVFPQHCEIVHDRSQGFCVVKVAPEGRVLVNGMETDFASVKAEEDYTLVVGRHLLLVRGDKDLEAWQRGFDPNAWTLFAPGSTSGEEPRPLLDVCRLAAQRALDPDSIVVPAGARMGFYLHQLWDLFAEQLHAPPPPPLPPLEPSPAPGPENSQRTGDFGSSGPDLSPKPPEIPPGPLRCPHCLLTFEGGWIMHIATDPTLNADPVLAPKFGRGPMAMLRFWAEHFNERRQALDPGGFPSKEIACPHCRLPLWPGFASTQPHILSIVGDQSAGKSYYLSALVRTLDEVLFRDFDVRFEDGDPVWNVRLNELVKGLFDARTPEEVHVEKTVLDGWMYEDVARQGEWVKMPRPFVFRAESVATQAVRNDSRSTRMAEHECSLIFYDNAGEHFQPLLESPGAEHIANAHGILFLFDPFNSPGFRQKIAAVGHSDPQLDKQILDQQPTILSETRKRLVKLLNLKAGQKINTPMAVLVGKCDAWLTASLQAEFRPPTHDGRVSIEAVRHNSNLVRKLMLEVAPNIVARAEGISSRVTYFPVSAFGHTPVRVVDPNDPKKEHFAPDPRRLKPFMVEVPALWLLSQVEPRLVPPTEETAPESA